MDYRLLLEVVLAIAALTSSYVGMVVQLQLSKLRLDMETGKATERETMRGWINGSFMRSATVEVQINELIRRMDEMARRMDEFVRRVDGLEREVCA